MAEVKKIIQDLDKVTKSDLSPGIPNLPGPLPTPEFIETIQRIESQKKQETPSTVTTEPQKPIQPTVSRPIVLEYKFKGECPNCMNEISTAIIKVQNKYIALAYCKVCGHDYKQQVVRPLEKEVDHGNNGSQARISKPKEVRKVREEKKIPIQHFTR